MLAGAGGALGSLDTALNVAFPALVDGLGISVADLQWVVVSYVLAYGGLLLAAGQWGDTIGHRRMLIIGAAGSTGAMVGCAMATDFAWFLAARVGQGVATAMVMAAAPALASLAADGRGPGQGRGQGRGRGRAIAVFQTATGAGAAMGPLVGGPLVELGGWPAVFWFRVPVCLALLWLAASVGPVVQQHRPRADVLGAALVALALTAGLLAVNSGRSFGLTSPALWLTVALTGAIGTGYAVRSRRLPAPILDLRLFADRRFSTANLLTVLANGAMFVAWLLVPALVVDRLGYSPVVGGLALAASPIAMGLAAPVAGRWSDRAGYRRPVIVGLAIEAIGIGWLATFGDGTGALTVAAAMAVIGVGLGLFGVPNMAMVMSALPDGEQGTAGGLSLLMRTTGIVIGVAGSAALFDALEAGRGFTASYRATTAVSAAVAAVAVVLATVDGRARSPVPAAVDESVDPIGPRRR